MGAGGPGGLKGAALRRISAPTAASLPRAALRSRKGVTMARTNPLTFLQQVRSETAKVSWPTRREVGVSTIMVLALTGLTAVFFFLVDLLIRTGLGALLGLVS